MSKHNYKLTEIGKTLKEWDVFYKGAGKIEKYLMECGKNE